MGALIDDGEAVTRIPLGRGLLWVAVLIGLAVMQYHEYQRLRPPSASDDASRLDSAPDLNGWSASGERVGLSDFGEDPALVCFSATWCAPCRVEVPELERCVQSWNRNPGRKFDLHLLLVVVDREKGEVSSAFEDAVHPSQIVPDPSGTIARRWNVEGVPTVFLVKGGKVLATLTGNLWGRCSSIHSILRRKTARRDPSPPAKP